MSNLCQLLDAGVFYQEQVDNFTDEEKEKIETMTQEHVDQLITIRNDMSRGDLGSVIISGRW